MKAATKTGDNSNALLDHFRSLADAMQTEATNWEWIGPHMSQRMFGITRSRAEAFAQRHGGAARQMTEAL